MNGQFPSSDAFTPLLDGACDGTLIETQIIELATVLDHDVTARKVYVDHVSLQTDIRFLGRAERLCSVGLAGVQATLPQALPSPSPAPIFTILPATHGMPGYFSSGWPVAYLIATVIFGIGALIGAFTYVSHPAQVARQSIHGPQPLASSPSSETESVGRITGMVDCQWIDESTAAINGIYVPLGRKYAISSGLLEITYDTGAKVILQGPVKYEVESRNSGFMSIGKLTGKVEVEKARGFVVRTPSAMVTDLGTEFGVEVDKRGVTTSRVFRGLVRVNVLANSGEPEGAGQLLRENESVRVDPKSQRPIVVVPAAKSVDFVREIPKPIIKTFDLVDVVAGGNGFSGRRDRFIDPTDGRATDIPLDEPQTFEEYLVGDGKYHPVESLPFIDGIFIPDGRLGSVQVDSAGHVYEDFGTTSNHTSEYLWAGSKLRPERTPFQTELGGIDYATSGHAMLFMQSNKGITFDLDAIRQANPSSRLLRFRTIAGMTAPNSEQDALGCADLWVLVDGQTRFKRREINSYNGAMPVVVSIDKNDRFLTLVSTDSGNGIIWDWVIFGDPRLELATTPHVPTDKGGVAMP